MNYLNGGYAMIKHNASQKDLENAYKSNRPVLVYDENQKAHWTQINEIVTTETIDDEVVTTYTYSYQLLNAIETLVDSAGNPRFIEGEGTIYELTGLTATYCKWSLSGTHLMLVVAGTIAASTSITQGNFAVFKVPSFILDKIYPMVNNNVSYLSCSVARATSIDTIQATFNLYMVKTGDALVLQKFGTTAIANDGVFRIQFDLLIDSE